MHRRSVAMWVGSSGFFLSRFLTWFLLSLFLLSYFLLGLFRGRPRLHFRETGFQRLQFIPRPQKDRLLDFKLLPRHKVQPGQTGVQDRAEVFFKVIPHRPQALGQRLGEGFRQFVN